MVPGCTNVSRKTRESNVSYHRLPIDQQMQRTWLRQIRRENLPKTNSCYVCSTHFTSDCFETCFKEMFGMQTKRPFKPGNVPSIFPFLSRKQGGEISSKRKQILEEIAREEVSIKIYITADHPRSQVFGVLRVSKALGQSVALLQKFW